MRIKANGPKSNFKKIPKINVQRRENGKKRLWYSDFPRHIGILFIYYYYFFFADYKFSIFCKCYLQSLHERKSGFQVLITCLNSLIESFVWNGTLSHNFEPMYGKLCKLWLTGLTQGIAKYEIWVILHIVMTLLSYRKSFCKTFCT